MLTSLRKRLQKDEDGFTLIELMVVVLIIAILIAIAIPTFLGAQDRARDRGAQSDLRNAVTAAKTIATDDAGNMTNVTAATLADAEGALALQLLGDAAATPPVPAEMIVVKSTGDTPAGSTSVLLYKQSASETWFGIRADKTGAVSYCKGDAVTDVNSISGCTDTKW